jgi:hypothetical protein
MPVDLASMDVEYMETAPAPDGAPPGTYQVQVKRAEWKETKNGKYYMLALETKILIGQHHGLPIFINVVITGEADNLKYVKRDLLKLGYTGPLSQIEANLETFLDRFLEVRVVQKKDKEGNENINTYISKALKEVKGYVPPKQADFAPPPLEDTDF